MNKFIPTGYKPTPLDIACTRFTKSLRKKVKRKRIKKAKRKQP